MASGQSNPSIVWLEKLSIGDIPSVGGKNASLGELVRQLGSAGVRVPTGFATTAQAFRDFVKLNAIEPAMRDCVERYRSGQKRLQDAGHAIRELMLTSQLPEGFADQIRHAYAELAERAGMRDPAVAVRSSATAEDLPEASFAGQHETFLNIRGEAARSAGWSLGILHHRVGQPSQPMQQRLSSLPRSVSAMLCPKLLPPAA